VSKTGDKFILKEHIIKMSLLEDEKRKKKIEKNEIRKSAAAATAAKAGTTSVTGNSGNHDQDLNSFDGNASLPSATGSVSGTVIGSVSGTVIGSISGSGTSVGTNTSEKKKKVITMAQRRDIEAAKLAEEWDKKDRNRRFKVLKVTGTS
jgi:hypothetical protein